MYLKQQQMSIPESHLHNMDPMDDMDGMGSGRDG